MSETRLSFKEMCTRFDVTARTLSHYEQIELLLPIRNGRSRFYGPRETARMTLILRGRRFGFSLEEIRQWLELYEKQGSAPQYQVFVDHADRQLDALTAQRDKLNETIEDLKQLRNNVAGMLS